jgi:phage/plasmid-associated DNA primase
MARCVQNPGKQAETAVDLKGEKGTGKGAVGRMMRKFFGTHALPITQAKQLVGSFNAHLADALFLLADEAFWAGDKQGEGALKGLITEDTVMIEPKGLNAFPMINRLKILILSNVEWVVPASADERRFFCLNVPSTFKSDVVYFTALHNAIDGPELSAFLDYLLKLDLSGFDHRNPPHTEALNEQ